ncbi:MAG: thiamine ABC transporter substrate-binding protein [Demequinaceae bacterium]|nr:thiamine ABC transporter substrate-binding protein [Demequinaceae bacterium]
MHRKTWPAIAGFLLSALALTGCAADPDPTTVTVVTHGSFAIPDDLVTSFERDTGLTIEFVVAGESSSLVNELILTQDHPLGDVVYGIDLASAAQAVEAGLFTDYSSDQPAADDAAEYAISGSDGLTAVDYSDVCINVDHHWFDERGIPEPVTLSDLASPTYRGLLSVTNPATSATGLSFLLATVAAFGEGWGDYWAGLRANDVRVVASWSDAYYTDFSGPSSGGSYPLVLSYASSPPFEVGEDGVAPTGALLDTCFRQVEYAGVLEDGANPEAAGKVIDWMLSDGFQAALPDSMYVYPVSSRVEVPEAWARYAPLSDRPWTLDPATIARDRDDLLRQWTEIVLG